MRLASLAIASCCLVALFHVPSSAMAIDTGGASPSGNDPMLDLSVWDEIDGSWSWDTCNWAELVVASLYGAAYMCENYYIPGYDPPDHDKYTKEQIENLMEHCEHWTESAEAVRWEQLQNCPDVTVNDPEPEPGSGTSTGGDPIVNAWPTVSPAQVVMAIPSPASTGTSFPSPAPTPVSSSAMTGYQWGMQ